MNNALLLIATVIAATATFWVLQKTYLKEHFLLSPKKIEDIDVNYPQLAKWTNYVTAAHNNI